MAVKITQNLRYIPTSQPTTVCLSLETLRMRHRHRMAESAYGGSALALAASFVVALAVPVAVPVPHDTAIKTGMQKHVDVHAE